MNVLWVRRWHEGDGREAGLSTWVCEQRMCESEAATNGVRETVVARQRARGQRLTDMNI